MQHVHEREGWAEHAVGIGKRAERSAVDVEREERWRGTAITGAAIIGAAATLSASARVSS